MCGLKHLPLVVSSQHYRVTPFVGVWIETSRARKRRKQYLVTPFVGVWIETVWRDCKKRHYRVTPFVGVWIETTFLRLRSVWILVTPFVGVWIETNHTIKAGTLLKSHPSWVCGLKQRVIGFQNRYIESHPSWVCGMKQKTDFIFWAHLKKSFLRKRAIDCQ